MGKAVWGWGLWCLIGPVLASAQVITTVAGADRSLLVSGVSALNAPLIATSAVATDSAGNYYLADFIANTVARVSPTGTFTVVAGNGHAGFSGDGGPATAASLNGPAALAVDSAGNVYIADQNNRRIRKVSGGIITTVVGNGPYGFSGDGGPAIQAGLTLPFGLAVDSAGNLYFVDLLNDRIRKVSGGTISTVAGSGQRGFSGDGGPALAASLNLPRDVAVDASGQIYIADYSNNRIRKVSANGIISTIAGNGIYGYTGDGGPAISALIASPLSVALDSAGNLFVLDSGNDVIRKISGGTITTVAGNGSVGFTGDGGPATSASLFNPRGIAVDTAGTLYIADYDSSRIRKVAAGVISTTAGNGGFSGDGGPATAASLYGPSGVATDAAGNLYIAEETRNRVRRVAPNGTITTLAGTGIAGSSGDGGPASAARLFGPRGMAVDAAGNLYIADTLNCRIRRISPGGVIATVAGDGRYDFSGDGGPATSASLRNPGSVAVDAAGNLYIADSQNNRIRKVSGGIITTVAGTGTAGFSGDNGPATSAMLSEPRAIAIDAAGNLYLGEIGNARVRKISLLGVITTVAGTGDPGFSGDGGPAVRARIDSPSGLATDAAGNLYIAQTVNHRIRKVSGETITTVVGNGEPGFFGDGGPPANASLNFPFALAMDAPGNLFISDYANNRVRAVLSGALTFRADPAVLTFAGAAGGSAPGSQTVTLSSSVTGLTFTAAANALWLTVSPAVATLPAALQVTADPSALAAGSYQGTVTITVPQATPRTLTIDVTFNVGPAASGSPSADAQSISFTATQGGTPLAKALHVTKPSGFTSTLTARASTTSGGSWLDAAPAATTAANSSFTITATPGSLSPGTYTGAIDLIAAGQTLIAVPVTLSIAAPAAVILISQNALSFSAVSQGGVPLPQTFGILNTGQGSMSWTASATTLSGGNWLRLSPASGTVPRPYLDVSLVRVSIDPVTLSPGAYYGRIEVASQASNSPQVLTVILNVRPPGFTLGPQVFPAGLIFTGAAGATPGSEDVQIGNPGGQQNSFVSGIIGTGLSYLPSSAALSPSQPVTLRVFPDFAKLTPGTIQQGTITLQFSDRSPAQSINVLLVVSPSDSSAPRDLSAGGPAADCASPGLQLLFRAPQPSLSTIPAVVGQPVAVDVQVTDGCGSLIGPGGQNAQVTARFSSSESVPLTHIGSGVWQGTWRPARPGTVLMQVVAFAGKDSNTVGGQSSVLSAAVSTPGEAAATPTLSAQGVVHAATALGGVPIAPGSLISVYGGNLSDSTGQTTLPLPENSNGTQVLLGNQPLPILYTSAGQLNVQVPYGVPVNGQTQLTVRRGNTLSMPQQLVVAAAQPGIFTANQTGTGQASITKSDQVTVARPGTPAAIGEVVVIYCTGLGSVTPSVREGQPAPSQEPLSRTDNPVSVTIGGKPADVIFSGLTPGLAGLYQVNAIVPSGIVTGDAVPVVLTMAGQTSPTVTIAVR